MNEGTLLTPRFVPATLSSGGIWSNICSKLRRCVSCFSSFLLLSFLLLSFVTFFILSFLHVFFLFFIFSTFRLFVFVLTFAFFTFRLHFYVFLAFCLPSLRPSVYTGLNALAEILWREISWVSRNLLGIGDGFSLLSHVYGYGYKLCISNFIRNLSFISYVVFFQGRQQQCIKNLTLILLEPSFVVFSFWQISVVDRSPVSSRVVVSVAVAILGGFLLVFDRFQNQ